MKRKKYRKKHSINKILSLLFALLLTGFTYLDGLNSPDANPLLESTIVHFIDVSQGDSSLILTGNQAILIDGGRNADEELVVEFIREQGVSTIDLIIATHPHEDHIGGLDAVMDNFQTDKILMPDVPHNTITYEDVITSANNNNVEIVYPDDKTLYEFKSGLSLKLLNPPSSFESNNLNNDSVVCLVEIGDTTILYTGDMEKELEQALMPQFTKVDILKVGHHGSHSSTTEDFINRTNPSIAIISCGLDNKYSHPHIETLDKLNSRNIEIRRTDYEGTITFEFDTKENLSMTDRFFYINFACMNQI